MTRVYYRFQGVPLDRPGGAWWYADYNHVHGAVEHGKAMRPFCDEVLILHGLNLPDHDPMAVKPPEGARALWVSRAIRS